VDGGRRVPRRKGGQTEVLSKILNRMAMLSSQFRIADNDQRRRRRRLASIVETLYGQTGLSNVEAAQQTIFKVENTIVFHRSC